MTKKLTILENYLPLMLSIIIVVILQQLKTYAIINTFYLGENAKDIFISMITFSAILTGFLSTIIAIVSSIPNNTGLIKLSKNAIAFKKFLNSLFFSILINFILVISCFICLIYNVKVFDFSTLSLIFVFILSYFFLSFIWIGILFFTLIKII